MKKQMRLIYHVPIVSFLAFFLGCSEADPVFVGNVDKVLVDIGSHRLQTYQKGVGEIPVLFESGLADMANVWNEKRLFDRVSESTKAIAYNRAGYAPSEPGPEPRSVQQINEEMLGLLNQLGHDKVILVGHSLGGMFIRSFAINFPDRVAGLVFLDPSHEDYTSENDPGAQAAIDFFKNQYGENDIRYKEAKELPAIFDYSSSLPNLPDIPVVVISSMKLDGNKDESDRQNWFDAHARLGEGVSDFVHLGTDRSGHYIMIDEPELVLDQLNKMLLKF
ncbi:MAG: hypothetical protein Tsb004_28140 [Allomuricauda sp.]